MVVVSLDTRKILLRSLACIGRGSPLVQRSLTHSPHRSCEERSLHEAVGEETEHLQYLLVLLSHRIIGDYGRSLVPKT